MHSISKTANLLPTAEAFYKNTGDTWRWCYSFNAILSFVALVLAALFYFPPTFGQLHEGLPVIDELKKKDWVGLVALTTFISTLQFVLMWGIIIYRSSYPIYLR